MKSFKDFFSEAKLYYPTKNAERGTDIGMTSVDPSKTFPSSDSTFILPYPTKIKKKKKTKKSKRV